jgi:protein ImuB
MTHIMTRIVSVWLPAWPIERLRRHRGLEEVPPDRPLALVAHGVHGLEITAVNEAARALRVRAGAGLADTRAALPGLITRAADRAGDRDDLVCLARWCGRYGPARNVDGDDALWIDITGVAHLFAPQQGLDKAAAGLPQEYDEAGERALLADLAARFSGLGLMVRAACADTLGAAHALARFATSPESTSVIAPPGGVSHALAPLPVAALRIDADAVRLLERLGLRRIGQLYGLPCAALERRFRALNRRDGPGAATIATVLLRLDQALGHYGEPRPPLVVRPDFTTRLPFSDPLLTAAGIEAALTQLCGDLVGLLAEAGVGGCRFRLSLYRSDGTLGEVAIGTSTPCRDEDHIRRLLLEKIAHFDAGFGIDLMTLEASEVTRLEAGQQVFDADAARAHARAAAQLVDRLSGRLGSGRVLQLLPHASHIPEAAQKRAPVLGIGHTKVATTHTLSPTFLEGREVRRPAFLLDPPEPIEVLAAIPEGAPALIVWRRVRRRIVRAEGPERIAPAWWAAYAPRSPEAVACAGLTRDYYLIEEAGGACYWVFRAGLYDKERDGEGAEDDDDAPTRTPRWFMHGLMP